MRLILPYLQQPCSQENFTEKNRVERCNYEGNAQITVKVLAG